MLVVDASCLYQVLTGSRAAEAIRELLADDPDHTAPHVIDVEVLSVLRREHQFGRLDLTAAEQAAEDLRDWPGERYGHRALIERAWELRNTVRTWDAMYVALAEALEARLLTSDTRLAKARGPRCAIVVVE